jgi:hypothetical protein
MADGAFWRGPTELSLLRRRWLIAAELLQGRSMLTLIYQGTFQA